VVCPPVRNPPPSLKGKRGAALHFPFSRTKGERNFPFSFSENSGCMRVLESREKPAFSQEGKGGSPKKKTSLHLPTGKGTKKKLFLRASLASTENARKTRRGATEVRSLEKKKKREDLRERPCSPAG